MAQAARALDLSTTAIYKWLKAFDGGGWEALKAGPVPGAKPTLTGEQQAELFGLPAHTNPRQLQLDFGLWTRERVRELIRTRFGVKLHVTAVGRLLRRMGMSPQRPLWRAWQQNPELVQRWKRQEYPVIAAEVKKAGARVWFGDEAGVRTDFHAGTTWAPVGQTPVVKTTGERRSVNMISAVTAKGELRFMVVDGRVNARVFLEFVKRLVADSPQPVFLVLDNHSIHKSKALRAHADASLGRLRLFHLPPYSPELNPDEWVWNNVKSARVGSQPHDIAADLKTKVLSALRRLQKLPQVVAGFFRAPDLAYIQA